MGVLNTFEVTVQVTMRIEAGSQMDAQLRVAAIVDAEPSFKDLDWRVISALQKTDMR